MRTNFLQWPHGDDRIYGYGGALEGNPPMLSNSHHKKTIIMKMYLLIVGFLLLVGLSGCDNTLADHVRIDDYEFYSLQEFNREIGIPKDVDVIANIRDSKKIQGPVKGGIITTMQLVNKMKEGDTLKVTFYGKDYRLFSIGEDFYEAKGSILSN